MNFISVLSRMTETPVPMLDASTPSFMGVPVARAKEELADADIAIIGVPYDTPPSAGRDPNSWAGFRTAPRVVRINSMKYAGYLPEFDLDVLEHLKVVDYGDALITEDVKESTANVISEGRRGCGSWGPADYARRLLALRILCSCRRHRPPDTRQARHHEPRCARRLRRQKPWPGRQS